MTTPPSDLALMTVAALWGAVAGALLPRAVHRFSVPWEERDGGWRATCPGGHPIRGWLGRARCEQCAERLPEPEPESAEPERESVPEPEPERAPELVPEPEFTADGNPASSSAPASFSAPTSSSEPSASSAPASSSEPSASSAPASSSEPSASSAPAASAATYAPGAVRLPLLTAVVCAALAAATGLRPELGVWLLLAPVGVLLAAVDLRVRRLPDPLTLPLAAAALVLLGPAALLPEHAGDWTTALLGALALGAGYLALHLVNPGGMAYGDVKLALSMGAVLGWYGWATVMLGTFAAFLLGALYGGALALVGRAGRKTMIAFGPFMLVGTFVGLVIGGYAA